MAGSGSAARLSSGANRIAAIFAFVLALLALLALAEVVRAEDKTASNDVAQALVAKRTLKVGEIVAAADVMLRPAHRSESAVALQRPEDAIGLEARLSIYQGRPIRPGDLGPPTIVRRNQIVTLSFNAGGLVIEPRRARSKPAASAKRSA